MMHIPNYTVKSGMVILFGTILFLIFTGFSNSDTKPVQNSESKSLSDYQNKGNGGIELDPQVAELLRQSSEDIGNIIMIGNACSHYQAAYGALPQSLENMLDGFMFIWPGSVYTKKPVQIIHRMPDPVNPDDVGKVFYERLNDFQGNIYMLGVDVQAIINGKLLWKVDKQKIQLSIYGQNPDGTLRDAQTLIDIGQKNRYLFGYRRNVYQALTDLMVNSLTKSGFLENTFQEILSKNHCYILKENFDILKELVRKNDVKFDFGSVGDGKQYYHDLISLDLETVREIYMQKCLAVEPGPYGMFGVNPMLDCPALTEKAKSIFNSKELLSIEIPQELMITKADVIAKY